MIKIREKIHYKNGVIIDFMAKPTLLQSLKNIGLDKNFVDSKEIGKKIKGFNKLNVRLFRLSTGCPKFLISKKGKSNGKKGRPPASYMFSGDANNYLKKYGSFFNEKGYLIKKIYDEEVIDNSNSDTEKDEVVQKETNQNIVVKEVEEVKPKIVMREYKGEKE